MKPILFNTDMVRALQDRRKSVTRRVVKPQPEGAHTILDCDEDAHTFDLLCGNGGTGGVFADWSETIKAPYWPGDILYVRETWQYKRGGGYLYKTDHINSLDLWITPDGRVQSAIPWRPSIHMPKEAARLFLRVTGVRVERLHDMQPYDIAFEGFLRQRNFIALWDSTIKKADRNLYGWSANPWVWVIEFERCEKPKEV